MTIECSRDARVLRIERLKKRGSLREWETQDAEAAVGS